MNLSLYALGTLCLVLSLSSLANTSPKDSLWLAYKENENIALSYRAITNSELIEIKAKTTIQSSISSFLLFIQDTQNIHQWLDNVHSSEVLEAITPQENVFITHFNSFWPISTRYMIVKSHYWQNEDLSLEIKVDDVADEKYRIKNMIQIKVIKAHWRIQPNKDNTITIEYNVIADPKGNIPTWLTKRLSLNGLWKTMNNLQEQLPLSRWQSHTIEHIKELN